MKTLYLECNMGAAGDMLTAALLELCGEPQAALAQINAAGIPGVTVTAESCIKQGINGTRLRVRVRGVEEGVHGEDEHSHDGHSHHEHSHEHDGHSHHEHDGHNHHEHSHDAHHHAHGALPDILRMIDGLHIPETVKEHAKAVYTVIAEAESTVHGVPVGEVHFHEVGALDAVADIVGCCLLMDKLKPERVLVSPVATGSGKVRCAHGLLPVPAPATALILRGMPIYAGNEKGELCTPTGAALLKHFADAFEPMPVMQVEAIGYGMGTKDFETANCVRAFWGCLSEEWKYIPSIESQVGFAKNPLGQVGTSAPVSQNEASDHCARDVAESPSTVTELACNLDDMTPEAVAFAQERLLAEGALDVYVTPVVMKKGRAGVLLNCLCNNNDTERLAALIFRHTATLGLRVSRCQRYTLDRKMETVQTPHGPVRVKTASGFGVVKSKPEYEDVAAVAREQGLSLAETTALLR